MKKWIFAFALISLTSTAFSQRNEKRRALQDSSSIKTDRTGNMKDAIKDLDLSMDQKKKIRDMRRENEKQKAAISQDSSLTEEQKKQKLRELNKKRQERIREILTPEQRKQLQEAVSTD